MVENHILTSQSGFLKVILGVIDAQNSKVFHGGVKQGYLVKRRQVGS